MEAPRSRGVVLNIEDHAAPPLQLVNELRPHATRGNGSVLNQLRVFCKSSAHSRTVIVKLRRGGGRSTHTRSSMQNVLDTECVDCTGPIAPQ